MVGRDSVVAAIGIGEGGEKGSSGGSGDLEMFQEDTVSDIRLSIMHTHCRALSLEPK